MKTDNMELRLWQYAIDDGFIPSFLEGMSIAHDEPAHDEQWFRWKFEQSPYGKAILACAFDDDCVAGCVAYGKGKFRYQGKEFDCALSYETFVHPNYQGKGLFKKLIDLAEKEAQRQRISFLYNFPNTNSLTGFMHMGWICRNDVQQYKIRITRPFHLLSHLLDLKKSFVPNQSNLDKIKSEVLDDICVGQCNSQVITPVWTSDYLKWRFFTYPNRTYFVINDDEVFSIAMVGMRGRLKDAHVLYVVSKTEDKPTNRCMASVLRKIRKSVKPDLISYSDSLGDDALSRLSGFIKVPSHSNFCYKLLDDSMEIRDFRIVLPSINAHTY